ncbi:MAG TPA: NADH-quinone oxidoreductase subunit C [Vicinamibacterales bacterium]|nr:NADH-quinone oxidoreductase subunit C [Vicinamibacterales bacterium]
MTAARLDPVAHTLRRIPGVTSFTSPRTNELHCRTTADALQDLASTALQTLGAELILVAGEDRRNAGDGFHVHYLFAHRGENWLLHASLPLDAGSPAIPSLARICYPASRFEREIRDLFGMALIGHPDPDPLTKHAFWPADYFPLRKDAPAIDFTDHGEPFPFTEAGGEGLYEIPVGPVHAGIIEPGHFRFTVLGETVVNLRTRLYFTHKGTEKLFEGRPPEGGVELAERISGDTSVGHAVAYAQAVESLARVEAPPRAQLIRVILLELERLYNHIGDVGAIATDAGFAVAQAHALRIRERLLRLNKTITGSRLLRGIVVPGGLSRDPDVPADLPAQIASAVADFDEIVAICLGNTLLVDRLEGTGVLGLELAVDHGALGYVARASGLDLDARRDHPFAAYPRLRFQVPVHTGGDVNARFAVRVDDVRVASQIIGQACRMLGPGEIRVPLAPFTPFEPAFGIAEGWRGRIVHWVMTDASGRLHRVKIVDPSFFNWPALSYALEDNIVPDFPLCNKSFNQSYSGNDL